MTTSLDAQRRITEHFDAFAPDYHDAAFAGAGMQLLSERDLDAVDRACSVARAGGVAFDVGVGSGRISSRLLHHGFSVRGVDASEGMLEVARERLGDVVDLVHGSLAEQLPLPSGQADLVTCLRVVKYLPDWPGAIAELARVAAPGGVVLFDLANRRSPARFGYPAGMVWPTTYADALDAIERAGLEVLEVAAGPHLPDPLWRAARRPGPARVLGGAEGLTAGVLRNVGARSWTFVTRRQLEPAPPPDPRVRRPGATT